MSLRPVDLQQVMVKSLDVTRETAQQQQLAAAVQDGLAAQLKARQAQKTETVQDFEEVGAAAVRERGPRSGGDGSESSGGDKAEQETELVDPQTAAALAALPKPRVGRHIDVQA